MKKLVLLITLVILSLGSKPVQADRPKLLFCPTYHAFKYKSEIQKLPGDKSMHCAMSCALALKCTNMGTLTLGWIKEFVDAIGPGDASMADMRANLKGVEISRDLHTKAQCIKECVQLYPVKE